MEEGMKKQATKPEPCQIVGYCRISTDKQDAERQRLDIYAFAEKNGLAVNRIVEETISSRKADREIYEVVKSLNKNDILLVTELSRLARSMMELHGIIADILKKGAILRVASGPVDTVDDSIASQAIVFAVGLSAQIERDLISERTRSALRARKAQGVKLGRPEGTRKAQEKIILKGISLETIKAMTASGASMAFIGRLLGIDARTAKAGLDSLKAEGK